MSTIKTGVKAHDDAVNLAEGVRQAAVVGVNQAAINAAEITFYRTCRASAIANGCGQEPFLVALRTLGVWS